MELDSVLREVLTGLLREIADGPPGEMAFIVNPGDPGLVRSLAAISAADASRRLDGRSSVAAHTQHLRYGFQLLNRWVRGDKDAFADAAYGESWSHQDVTDAQWQELRDGLQRELASWVVAMGQPRQWDSITLSGAISSVAHTAYHMGAIRQLVRTAAGPPAKD